MATGKGVWRLEIGGAKYMGLIPHDLNYFHDLFVGSRMPETWTPPPATESGKSKKLPDFVSWMAKAPVVSERARSLLQDLASSHVQFLTFHEIRSKRFFVMNIVTVERDVLDSERSDIKFSIGQPRFPLSLRSAVFRQSTPDKPLPPIFKVALPDFPNAVFSEVFVTESFADVVIRNQLTGASLADPKEDSLHHVLSGKSPNVVPGIPE